MKAFAIAAVFAVLAVPSTALAAPPTLHPVTTSSPAAAVRPLQQKLSSLGYLTARNVDGSYDSATVYAVLAFQKQAGLSRDGIAGPQTIAALRKAARPTPAFNLPGRRVEISIGKQLAYLIDDNTVVRTIEVSTAGPGHYTPTGRFHIYGKSLNAWSNEFHVWLPYSSFVVGGIYMHGYPDVPAYPASHGCIRVPLPFAPDVYAFTRVGTQVYIH